MADSTNSPAEVKERPILFSGPMVCALLDGRKTQTRRVVKTPAAVAEDDPHHWVASGGQRWREGRKEYEFTSWPHDEAVTEWRPCPYGSTGDRLWVREAWALVPATAYRHSEGVQQVINPADPDMAAIFAAGWDRSIPKPMRNQHQEWRTTRHAVQRIRQTYLSRGDRQCPPDRRRA